LDNWPKKPIENKRKNHRRKKGLYKRGRFNRAFRSLIFSQYASKLSKILKAIRDVKALLETINYRREQPKSL